MDTMANFIASEILSCRAVARYARSLCAATVDAAVDGAAMTCWSDIHRDGQHLGTRKTS